MNQLYAGCLVEVVKDTPGARHPMEHRGLAEGDRFFIKSNHNGTVTYASLLGDLRVTQDRLRLIPTVGAETARDDLCIDRFRSDEWFVYRKSDNQILCQGVEPALAPFKVYRPLIWDKYKKAEEWINDGVIADLQEALGNLNIRFTKVLAVNQR